VVGKPHAVLGEVPVAFVVPGPDGFDPSALLAMCRERLSYFKVPEEIYEIARVPRTASGKITRHVLLELPARLRAAGDGQYDSLLRLDWVPQAALPDAPVGNGTWALMDADALGLAEGLRGVGVDVRVVDGAVVADDCPSPDVVVVAPAVRNMWDIRDEGQDPTGELTARLGAWLADDRLAGTRFVACVSYTSDAAD
ncbi:AMP-binding enzyme, partial [Streptomyces rhizosphaericus]|uniref:AMP-binding enzyme n=1 Tax=Streptomyces rhizosphaericus TaxID=114699 RepID=UPI00118093B0